MVDPHFAAQVAQGRSCAASQAAECRAGGAARMRDTRHFRLAVIPFSGSQSEECIAEPPLPEPQRLQKRRTCAPTCLLRDNCSVAARMRDIRHFQATGAPTRLLRRLKSALALKPLQHPSSINLSLFNIIFN